MHRRYNAISIVILVCFLVSTIAYGKSNEDKTGELINVAPNASLSATVIHPKKLDIVLMTDYTGTKKSSLLTDVNKTISNLFSSNVDAKLYVEDTSNPEVSGHTYYEQEYDGAPTRYDDFESSGGNKSLPSTRVNTSERILTNEYGVLKWYYDNTISFTWNYYQRGENIYVTGKCKRGEAPIEGGILTDAPRNIAKIGLSKHAVYILTDSNNLYMSGDATAMTPGYSDGTPYTGMRCVLTGVKDIKTNLYGIAVLKTDGTVYYAGNVGLVVQQYGQGTLFTSTMDVSTKSESRFGEMPYLVTQGFQQIPGMNNITRIQLGNKSIIGLNDNTGDVYGIGYSAGQFGWTDPYFQRCTNSYWDPTFAAMPTRYTKKIPLLNARNIKNLYMYGIYTEVIQKDNTIWRLEGGGFTTYATPSGMYTGMYREYYSQEPGKYTKIGTLTSNELLRIDTTARYELNETITDNYIQHAGLYVNAFYTKYSYNIKGTYTQSINKTSVGLVNSIKSLNTNDVMDRNYRIGSDKIILYVSDSESTNFSKETFGNYYPMTGLTQNFMFFLNKSNFASYVVSPSSMLNYIENIYTKQEVSLRQLINSSLDGHLYDKGNYAQALKDIEARYSNNKEALNKYVIVNEDLLQYNTQFIDRENDIKKAERWMYSHEPSIFKNNTGTISTNNQWLDNPITMFEKVGLYGITYQAQDDPTQDSNFDNYNNWSNQTDQLEVIAHRRPIAKFTAKIPKEIVTSTNLVENFDDKHEIEVSYNSYCTIQNNGIGGSKALNGKSQGTSELSSATISINVPVGVTNALLSISLSGVLYTVKLDDITLESLNSYNDLISLTPGTHTLKIDTGFKSGYKWDDQYFPPEYGSFVLDNLNLTYDNHTWINGNASDYVDGKSNITYNNTSYDIDHTEISDNKMTLNSILPDKGIAQEEWHWVDVTPGFTGTWQLGQLDKYTKNHIYLISLKVKDIEGAWSDPYIVVLGDSILETNNPPIAKFSLEKLKIVKGEGNTITDLSYDPDMDDLAEWHWRLLDANNVLIKDYGSTKPNLSSLNIGNYKLELTVRDNPLIPPTMWSAPYTLSFEVTEELLNLTASLTPNPAKRGQMITITAITDGFAQDLTFYFPTEITSIDTKTTFPIYKTIKVENHHVEKLEYYLPLQTPYTLDENSYRLRTPYIITVQTSKNGKTKKVDLQLDVMGNIYNGIKTELR